MSKTKIEDVYTSIIEDWNKNKGVGTILIQPPFDPNSIIKYVLERVYAKNPKIKTLIVVDSMFARSNIIDMLTNSNCKANNKEFYDHINNRDIILLTDYYIANKNYSHYYDLVISVGQNEATKGVKIATSRCKFKLIILTKYISDYNKKKAINDIAPIITNNSQLDSIRVLLNSPVEETRIGVPITDTFDLDNLNKYNDFINVSMSIFGDFGMIDKARSGDKTTNKSSSTICTEIAVSNGWSPTMDMNIAINKEIDAVFNPNNLYDRAHLTYDIIRKRNELVSCNQCKIPKIIELCREYKNKKILIINKKAEFANDIHLALLEYGIKNVAYHDKLSNVLAYDDKGKPILYKSGAKAGQQKQLGVKSQKSLYQRQFDAGEVNIICTNSSPDKALSGVIDLLIITSPLCDTINEYKYRLSNIRWSDIPNKVIKLYCTNTMEEKALEKEEINEDHIVITNNDISYENFAPNICVD